MEKSTSVKLDFILKQCGNHVGVFESQLVAQASMKKLSKGGWNDLELFARTRTTTEDMLKIG